MIFEYLKTNDQIGILGHMNPDIDCISSMILIKNLLEKSKIKSQFLLKNQLPNHLKFLTKENFKFTNRIHTFNKFICLDCANYERLSIKIPKKNLINIDHHNTNTNYAEFNIVDKTSVSTTQLIYKILKSYNIKPSLETAKLIIYGIYSDTQNLTTKNVSSETLRDCAQLTKLGIDINQITKTINKISTQDLETLSKVLLNSKKRKQFAVSRIKGSLKKDHLRVSSSYLSQLKNTEMSVLITENNQGETRTSLRSKNIDVSKIAKKFNGGGHKNASGFSYKKRSNRPFNN